MQDANQKAMDAGVAKQKSVYSASQITGITLLVIGLILGFSVLYICYMSICRPVAGMNKALAEIIENINAGNGDLTKRLNIRAKDEIGIIGDDINKFIETLQEIMKKSPAILTSLKILSVPYLTRLSKPMIIHAIYQQLWKNFHLQWKKCLPLLSR